MSWYEKHFGIFNEYGRFNLPSKTVEALSSISNWTQQITQTATNFSSELTIWKIVCALLLTAYMVLFHCWRCAKFKPMKMEMSNEPCRTCMRTKREMSSIKWQHSHAMARMAIILPHASAKSTHAVYWLLLPPLFYDSGLVTQNRIEQNAVTVNRLWIMWINWKCRAIYSQLHFIFCSIFNVNSHKIIVNSVCVLQNCIVYFQNDDPHALLLIFSRIKTHWMRSI